MAKNANVAELATQLPALLATLPADAGEVVRIEIVKSDIGGSPPHVEVHTWRTTRELVSDGAVCAQVEGVVGLWRLYVVDGKPRLELRSTQAWT